MRVWIAVLAAGLALLTLGARGLRKVLSQSRSVVQEQPR